MSDGVCCSEFASEQDDSPCSSIKGYSSVEQSSMMYFLCPQGQYCGPRYIKAREKSLTYSIDTAILNPLENLCNHDISFSIEGGINDILEVKFKEFPPGTRVFFAVGKSFQQAEGETLDNLQGVVLKVSFPN